MVALLLILFSRKIIAFWLLITESDFKIVFPWSAKNDSKKRHKVGFKRRILDLSNVNKGGIIS